jgi:hypothetical protein
LNSPLCSCVSITLPCADEKLTTFMELESAVHAYRELS